MSPPVYVRGEHNIFSEGITRWSQNTLGSWSTQEGMSSVNAADQFWVHLPIPFNTHPLAPIVPGTFAMFFEVLLFSQRFFRYRVREWRPINYVLAGILENWGVPVFFDHLIERDVYDILIRNTLHPVLPIDDRDIFILVGRRMSWRGICDFRRTVSMRQPRYSAMAVPMGISDNAVSELWTSPTLIDPTLTGDAFAAQWAAYCSGGITSAHFYLRPNSAELRHLLQSYRLAGLVCEDDPIGVAHTHIIPGTVGGKTVITADGCLSFNRNSHIPYAHSLPYIDEQAWRPAGSNLGRHPTPYGKLTILGGHVAMRTDVMTEVLCEHIAPEHIQWG